MTFLATLGLIVLVLWILGLIFSIGGWLIHILLVVAGAVFIIDWLSGRKK